MRRYRSPLGPPPPEVRAAAIARLSHHFPGVPIWFGDHTHTWWALVPEGRLGRLGRLVEALSPQELATAIRQGPAWPWP